MILRAAWVVPVCEPPIRDGFVQFTESRIVRVGSAALLSSHDVDELVDLGEAILTPGLVNPHTHLELTCYAGALPPAPFWDWIRQLIPLRAMPGALDQEAAAALIGAWQSLRAGVTCVGDISRCNVAWRGLKHVPIRKVCFAEMFSVAEQPPRTPEELRTAFDEIEEDHLLTAGVTPHAPYSVTTDHLHASIRLASERERPWCTHWSETREEVAFVRGEPNALPPFFAAYIEQKGLRSPRMDVYDYLARVVDGGPPGILAHGNYFSAADFPRIAAAGHTVVYCPRAHRFFQHSPHPLPAMLAAGVRMALGTDSAASNENLSMLEEARFVRANVEGAPDDDRLMRMITIDAAAALGLGDAIGTLEVGKQADIAAFLCDSPGNEPTAALLTRPYHCVGTWVAGQRVV